MITLYPLKYNDYYNYYKSLNFTLSETSLLLNINGTFVNQNISKIIQLNKNAFITSETVINNSLTALYTYLLVDLNSYTYASNNITFNSTEPHKPEFLLYFNSNYVCINDYVASVTSSSQSTGTSGGSGSGSSSGSGSGSGSGTGSGTSTSGTTTSSNTSTTTTVLTPTGYTDTGVPIYDNINIKSIVDVLENIGLLPYTRTFAGTQFPTNVQNLDTFYNTNTNKYYIYFDNAWYYVNWIRLYYSMIKSETLALAVDFTQPALYHTDVRKPNFDPSCKVIPVLGYTTKIMSDSYNFALLRSNTLIQNNATNVTFPYFLWISATMNIKLPEPPKESSSYKTFLGILQNNLLYTSQTFTLIYNIFDRNYGYSSMTIYTNIPFYGLFSYDETYNYKYDLIIQKTYRDYIQYTNGYYINSFDNPVLDNAYTGQYVFLILPIEYYKLPNELYLFSASIISATIPQIIIHSASYYGYK